MDHKDDIETIDDAARRHLIGQSTRPARRIKKKKKSGRSPKPGKMRQDNEYGLEDDVVGTAKDANDDTDDLDIGTVADACRVIGGRKPINPATFYRGVRAGRYSILKPSPGITRVDLAKLREDIRAAEKEGEAK